MEEGAWRKTWKKEHGGRHGRTMDEERPLEHAVGTVPSGRNVLDQEQDPGLGVFLLRTKK